jgi:hypothetical protein
MAGLLTGDDRQSPSLKRLPPDLNRRDSHEVSNERVFWH